VGVPAQSQKDIWPAHKLFETLTLPLLNKTKVIEAQNHTWPQYGNLNDAALPRLIPSK
jgi:hypothetical protein